MNSHEQKLQAKADEVRGRLQDLSADLRVVDDEVGSFSGRRTEHELLQQACASLEKLGELGAAELFWGDRLDAKGVNERLREVRGRVDAFQVQLDELDARRQTIVGQIGGDEEILALLDDDLHEIREEEERKKLDWIIEREISDVPRRVQLMAWARGAEEDRRFRKTLGVAILVSIALGALLPMIPLPLPKRFIPDEMPRRLAQLVRQELAQPVPPPPVVADTKPEEPKPEPDDATPPEPQDPVTPDTPTVAQADAFPPELADPGPIGLGTAPVTRKAVAKAGILAFKDEFASLAKDDVAPRLGADARLGDADDTSRDVTRSMLTTNAPGSSGGIDLGSLSRGVGGGGGGTGEGGGIQGVPLGRATSSIAMIGGGEGGADRPRARGAAAASRTDEEIQIVFDRYKSAFYRMYNRELRNDPTLRGQMVLQLTIEPDGSVSMCELQSSDMDAPQLATQVVHRVRTIHFGAKESVKAMTIVYPIDFLPAA